ncbi:FGGY family carbohydrate kinase [Herbiconiux sp.]|uniref:FGGY-family carbohydrate kinase n=1 Tax=Herbiconiux sp. TaxID=1871186 RepID=UPI0025BBBBDC|nr:FGGY family carbohydrate kinase [Herbiconiux sp.]
MLPTITVDVGTTSVKLCLFDAAGALQASAREATPTRADAWGEVYDLEALDAVLTGFVGSLDADERRSVKRIAITGVGESGGLVREDLSLASPMILWHDHRGADRLSGLDAAARREIYAVTGLPVNANYGLSKVAWAVENADAGSAADAQWLNISEYLAARMTGERWAEYSLASRTLALDLGTRTWSASVAGLLGVDVGVFPPLRSATEGSLVTAAFARATGLGTDVEVHVAGHDHVVGAAGSGLARGELLNSTGTTEGLLVLREAPSTDVRSERAKLANGLSSTGGDATLFASIPTGGSAFATLQNMLGLDADALTAVVARLHARYLAGEIDLRGVPLVLPEFRGSPPPTKNAKARGVIAGLHSDTTLDEIVFGTFLGMALQFRDVLELFPEEPTAIKVIGPASRNPLWLQLKADLLDAPLSVSRFPEVVSVGAQALASGERRSWAECDPSEVDPDQGRAATLAEWQHGVAPLWQHLKEGAER